MDTDRKDSALKWMALACFVMAVLSGGLCLAWWYDDEAEALYLSRQIQAIQSIVRIEAELNRVETELELIRKQLSEPVAVLPKGD